MYEDRTLETITEEMLEDFGADVRTDEGSLAYNAVVKTASELEDVYTDMEELEENALVDTMDISHLIRYSGERGISYKYATAPVVKGVFQQSISIGDRFTCKDYVYTVSEAIDDEEYTYLLTCETEGTEANTIIGELDPVDYIDNYLGGEITEVSVLGTDDEDEEVFRGRIIDSFASLAFGGNKSDYRLYTDALTGVGGCKPKRRDATSEYINIYIIDSSYGVPSDTLINQVQNAIDPTISHGEGDGKAPICHKVLIRPVIAVDISVSATLQLDDGYTADTIQPQAVERIEAYLLSMRKEWEDNELNESVVRLARIEAALIDIEGVIDVTDLKLNDEESNINIAWTDIPTLNSVTIS